MAKAFTLTNFNFAAFFGESSREEDAEGRGHYQHGGWHGRKDQRLPRPEQRLMTVTRRLKRSNRYDAVYIVTKAESMTKLGLDRQVG